MRDSGTASWLCRVANLVANNLAFDEFAAGLSLTMAAMRVGAGVCPCSSIKIRPLFTFQTISPVQKPDALPSARVVLGDLYLVTVSRQVLTHTTGEFGGGFG
jgi:hypothetical protein